MGAHDLAPARVPHIARTARTAAERGIVALRDAPIPPPQLARGESAPASLLAQPPAAAGCKTGGKALVKRVTRNKNANAATAGKHTSAYRGVTLHRWTGRYEARSHRPARPGICALMPRTQAHLWDSNAERPGATGARRRGRQVYLGGYATEEAAARAYDLLAIKLHGLHQSPPPPGKCAVLNFPFESYADELDDIASQTTAELVASLRRSSSSLARGAPRFRGGAKPKAGEEGAGDFRIAASEASLADEGAIIVHAGVEDGLGAWALEGEVMWA